MPRNFSPHPGKWTINNLIKEKLETKGGEMPLEDLLNHLSTQGYHKESLRQNLKNLDMEVVNGKARLR